MQNTGKSAGSNPNLSTLTERLRAKAEQERQEIETMTRQQFNALQESLSASLQNALSITEAATKERLSNLQRNIDEQCRILNWMFGKKCLQGFFLTLAIFSGAALAGWGVMRWASGKFMELQAEIANMTAYKTALEKTLMEMKGKTWGLEFTETKDGRFIVLPPKTTISTTNYTSGNRKALKLE